MRLGFTWGIAVLAGCAGLADAFKAPDLHLDRAIVRGLQVGIDVEDSHLGDIEYNSAFQMPKGDSTLVTLPIRFTWSGLAGAARAALGSGDLPYTLKAQLTVETPFGDRVIPFTREGRAPLTRVGGLLPIPTGQ